MISTCFGECVKFWSALNPQCGVQTKNWIQNIHFFTLVFHSTMFPWQKDFWLLAQAHNYNPGVMALHSRCRTGHMGFLLHSIQQNRNTNQMQNVQTSSNTNRWDEIWSYSDIPLALLMCIFIIDLSMELQ